MKMNDPHSAWRHVFHFILAFSALFYPVISSTHDEASAATYYIAPSGSDGNSGGSAAPFRTIQKAANIVNPGDTVVVRDGVYTDTDDNSIVVNLSRGGTQSAWVTFRSENVWGAVVDCQGKANWGWNFNSNANYVRIEGFEVRGCLNDGLQVTTPAHDLYISGNHVHHIGNISSDSQNGKNAFYAGSSAHHIIFDSNVVHHIGRIADSACANSTPTNACYNHDHGFYISSDDTEIINNVVYETKAGWGVQLAPGAANIRILNNTFAGANPGRDGHITLWGGQTNLLIANNIFYQPKTAALSNTNCTGDSGIVIRNNLSTTANMVSGTSSCLALSGNITGNDPKFIDAAGFDFHLQATSPAINKGILTGYEYDADGNAVAGVPDLGAYEYVGSSDILPPTVPAGLAATAVSSSQIHLSWAASIDNVGVAGYAVYRNGTRIASVAGRSYSDTGLSPGVTYTYTVAAYDAKNNASALSAPVSVKTLPSGTSSAEIIIDNGAAGTSFTGSWGVSGGSAPYGSNSLWSRDGATYTWQTKLPASGTYKVYVWWTYAASRSANVPIAVTFKGGSQTLAVNQQLNGGMWNYLGSFPFDALLSAKVTLSAPGPSPASYSADAVRFVLDSGSPVVYR